MTSEGDDCDPVSSHNNYGVLLCDAGKMKEAIAHFREALRHVRSDPAISDKARQDIFVSADEAFIGNPPMEIGDNTSTCSCIPGEADGDDDVIPVAIVSTFDPYDGPPPRPGTTATKEYRCMKICRADAYIFDSFPHVRQYDKRPSIIMMNLGVAFQKAGLDDEANEIYLLSISYLQAQNKEHIDRDDHLIQATVRRNIGQMRLEEEDLQQSLILFSDAFEAAQAHLSLIANLDGGEACKREPNLKRARMECLDLMMSSLSNMGKLYFLCRDYSMARMVAEETVEFVEDMPQTYRDNIATILFDLALAQYMEGKLDTALKGFGASLQHVRARHGKSNHPLEAAVLFRIGITYFSQMRYDDSMKYLVSALSIREAQHGKVHGDVANVLFMIGRVLLDQEEYAFAINVYRRTASVQRALGDESKVAMSLYMVGRTHLLLGELNNALSFLWTVVNIIQRNPRGHTQKFLLDVMVCIGRIYAEQRNAEGCMTVCSDLATLDLPEEVLTSCYMRMSKASAPQLSPQSFAAARHSAASA